MNKEFFENFRKQNKLRCESIEGFNHSINSWSQDDWVVALVGEFGEAMNVIKKLNRLRDGLTVDIVTKEKLLIDLGNELADCFCYADLLMESITNNIKPKCLTAIRAIYTLNIERFIDVLVCYAKKYDIDLQKFNKISNRIGYPVVVGGNFEINK